MASKSFELTKTIVFIVHDSNIVNTNSLKISVPILKSMFNSIVAILAARSNRLLAPSGLKWLTTVFTINNF